MFAIALLGYLLSAVIGGALEGVVVGVTTFNGAADSVSGAVVSVVAGTLSSMVTTPFVAAFVTVLYFDLRVRREGFDLQRLAERIGVEPQPGAAAAARAEQPADDREQPPFWPPPPGWRPGGGSE